MGLHKTKKFLHRKENNQQSKETTYRMKIGNTFANHTLDKGLISEIYKELKQLSSKKMTQFKNGQKN